jgi:transposase
MLTGCPEATCAATPAWIVCAGWSAVTVRCWRSTWPTTPRWWWSATTTRGCWPAGPGGAAPGSWIGRWVGAGGGVPAGLCRCGGRLRADRAPLAGGGRAGQQAGAGGRLGAAAAGAPGPRAEDFTDDKSDDKDALLIARLTTQLHCYLPERPTAAWARLRHLGNRRVEQLALATAAQQRLRDLLECGWPAALEVARHPLDSLTWWAAMTVGRCDPAHIRRLGFARFARAVAGELPRWGGRRRNLGVLRALYAATGDDRGVQTQRAGALERSALVLADFKQALAALAEVEGRMAKALAELDLAEPVTTIRGLSVVGAATILAETGDPARFDDAQAVVKQAGLCPRDNASGGFTGTTTISGRGRPLLRLAAWRAVWGALPHNPVFAARYAP